MKNLLILGAVALLLFSLSAALSLWLNQSRQEAEKAAQAEKDAKEAKAAPKPPAPPAEGPKEAEKPGIPKLPPPAPNTPDAGPGDQEERLKRKALQLSLVLADVQSQREATDALIRQVSTALRDAAKAPAPDPTEAERRRIEEEARRIERVNLLKLAAVYDAMTPEGAAPIFKQFAESGTGKLEQAAQILVLMQQRKAAQLLEALNDASLAAQLTDKVRQLRAQGVIPPPAPPTVVPGAAPASPPGGITPVRGP